MRTRIPVNDNVVRAKSFRSVTAALPPAAQTPSVRSLIAVLLLLVSTGAAAEEFKRGEIVDGVACVGHPEITYAYYLPARYTPRQPWPVLFVFDPRQRGAYAAELSREPAEQFGWIVISSNNTTPSE